ncbi:MAG: P1 family peptidase [Chloroflexi bacterium]|nr:P1 family peptidase [Chloroflexota bacterium]
MKIARLVLFTLIIITALSPAVFGDNRVRARDLGIIIGDMEPGKYNAITDVPGVMVGHVTKNSGDGEKAVRTGVTAILPHGGDIWREKVPAGGFVFNGCGELTGLHWVNEGGALEVPILLTNTHCVGRVSDGVVGWMMKKYPEIGITDDVVTPVVGECDDSALNDIRGRHITEDDVISCIQGAMGGEVAEGVVGAGAGMICYQLKGGIGTASRRLPDEEGGYTVGVLVLANFGSREELIINGVPVGKELDVPVCGRGNAGSVIVVIATDAPLDSRQLTRLCKRAVIGIGRTGTCGHHGSGDFFVAFSTAYRIPHYPEARTFTVTRMADTHLDSLFQAVVESTEEAVINTLCMAETVTGRDGNTAYALPVPRLMEIMKKYNRL